MKTVPFPVVAGGNNAFNKEIPQDVDYHGHFLFQMGGNLITDCNGMLHLVYCSKTSKDRPNVSLIVDVLQVTTYSDPGFILTVLYKNYIQLNYV